MSSTDAGPVKSISEHRARPGDERALEEWLRATVEAASQGFGLEGSTVLTPGSPGHYFLLLRFATPADLARWEASGERARLEAQAGRFVSAGSSQVRQGLATWFTLEEHRTSADPPRWKMAIVTWCALFPQIVLFWSLTRGISAHPVVIQAVTSALCVMSLAWIVMPRLTRWLHPWLVRRR